MIKALLLCSFTFCICFMHSNLQAQSLEYFGGNQRSGIDIMWFKSLKNKEGAASPFLFFSRTRASVPYTSAAAAFGSTTALSYNFKNGFGLVAVASFVNAGFTPKAGLQYVKQKGCFTFFGWLVAEAKKEGNVDLFGLFRFLPKLNQTWKGFFQVELFPVYKASQNWWSLTQRIRLGAKRQSIAAGCMGDFSQTGSGTLVGSYNLGGFIRYDF